MLSTASAALRKRAIESSFKARNSVKIKYWSPNRVKFSARTPTVLGARRCCGGRPRSISLSARNACSGPLRVLPGQGEHGFNQLLGAIQMAFAPGPLLERLKVPVAAQNLTPHFQISGNVWLFVGIQLESGH